MASGELVFITGTTGFIGFRTLVWALKAGYRVRAAVRSASKGETIQKHTIIQSLQLPSDALTFAIVSDFSAPGAFDEAVKDAKYIIHVASPLSLSMPAGADPVEFLVKPAVRGTLSVYESAKNSPVERIVVTSSVVALMNPKHLISEVMPDYLNAASRTTVPSQPWPTPLFGYAASKISALNESEAWVKANKPSFDVITIHPSYVHGRNDLAATPDDAASGTNFPVINVARGAQNGDVRKNGSGVHVEDVARIQVESLNPQIAGNQSFVLAVPIAWEQVPRIVAKHFPTAVAEGIFSVDGEQKSLPVGLDTWETEQTFGKLMGFEDQVVSIVKQYVDLKSAA